MEKEIFAKIFETPEYQVLMKAEDLNFHSRDSNDIPLPIPN